MKFTGMSKSRDEVDTDDLIQLCTHVRVNVRVNKVP